MPHLSVIVPAYNSEKTLSGCLESITASSYKDYELIVVDRGSRDDTNLTAKRYTDNIVTLEGNFGRNYMRKIGVEASNADIIVNVDSDVVLRPDTLFKIVDYLSKHPDIDAVTGLLSVEHPNRDFFSQYKNLYMHYIFSNLPERASFIYGSIFAYRRDVAAFFDDDFKLGEDTAFGQRIISKSGCIAFLRDLEVTHLKRYNAFTFVKNDFLIPFYWAKIFLRYKGWRQVGKNGVGFAHSPKEQLVSVIIAPIVLFLVILSALSDNYISISIALIFAWFFLNRRFFAFLTEEKGSVFVMASVVVTFLDNVVMAMGIACGILASLYTKNLKIII